MKNCVDCKKWKCRCLYCPSRSEKSGKWYCDEVEDYCENASCPGWFDDLDNIDCYEKGDRDD